MRLRILFPLAAVTMLFVPAVASADFAHVVGSGESLYSVAAADGLSVSQLAAANGLSPSAQLIAGSTLMIPPQGVVVSPAATSSAVTSRVAPTAVTGDGDADSDDVGSSATSAGSNAGSATTVASSAGTGGSYVVQPGDTLSGIAARAGLTVSELATANGLDPNGLLLYGTVLRLSGSGGSTSGTYVSSANAATSQPVGASAQGTYGSAPYPTPERVTPSEVGSIAAANGVPPSLAQAIGYQESGFNNDLVSSADARGVMQILPGTWNWIGQTLAGPTPLAPASAASNVRAGVLLLHSLLNATGGNQAMAAAGYYQGLPSVLAHGMYSDTQHYVQNVQALQGRFGGG